METFLLIMALALSILTQSVSAQQPEAQANCTMFNWDQQPAYYKYSTRTQRISAATTCNLTSDASIAHFCGLSASGDIQAGFSYNISQLIRSPAYVTSNTAQGQGSYIHELVRRQVDLEDQPWNASIIGIIDTTQTLSPGTSAFLNFTYLTRCYAGSLSNCTGGISDGVSIEVCSPVYHTTRGQEGIPIVDGRYDQVNISASNVSQYTNPFEGLSRGSENAVDANSQQIRSSLTLILCSFSIALLTL